MQKVTITPGLEKGYSKKDDLVVEVFDRIMESVY
jgi:hypothetical protein